MCVPLCVASNASLALWMYSFPPMQMQMGAGYHHQQENNPLSHNGLSRSTCMRKALIRCSLSFLSFFLSFHFLPWGNVVRRNCYTARFLCPTSTSILFVSSHPTLSPHTLILQRSSVTFALPTGIVEQLGVCIGHHDLLALSLSAIAVSEPSQCALGALSDQTLDHPRTRV